LLPAWMNISASPYSSRNCKGFWRISIRENEKGPSLLVLILRAGRRETDIFSCSKCAPQLYFCKSLV
jgi:hypothetical protein